MERRKFIHGAGIAGVLAAGAPEFDTKRPFWVFSDRRPYWNQQLSRVALIFL